MIERENDDGIVTLRLAHGKASAMDIELLDAFDRALDALHDARAVILTGTGSIFSAGVDLFRLLDGGPDYARAFFPRLGAWMRRLFTLQVPLVVAANGHAIAGGGLMVMAGDLRLMAEGKGRVGVPELVVGVPFPAAALEVVRWAVPADRIQRLLYTGRTLEPAEAKEWGLIDEVVPADALMDRARAAAGQIAALDPTLFRLTRQALRADALARMDAADAYDARAAELWAAPETAARIRAYLDATVRR